MQNSRKEKTLGAINQKEVTPSLFWVLISRPLIKGMSVFVCVGAGEVTKGL